MRRAALTGALLATVAVMAGCSSHGPAAAPPTQTAQSEAPPPGRPNPHRFLASNAAAKTVRLAMLASLGSSNGGYNFDDYGRGELIASVPKGWRVTVLCQNRGSRRTSCALVSGARSATLAFPGASVKDPTYGISPGEKAQFSFTPTRPGVYRLTSLVPGQADARMYAVLVVTRGGRPSIYARPGP